MTHHTRPLGVRAAQTLFYRSTQAQGGFSKHQPAKLLSQYTIEMPAAVQSQLCLAAILRTCNARPLLTLDQQSCVLIQRYTGPPAQTHTGPDRKGIILHHCRQIRMHQRRYQPCPTSEMYRGTSAELRPMAMPARKRPATIMFRLVAAADSSGPASIGTAHSMKDRRRPSALAKPPPVRLPRAAPASVLLTTCRMSQVSDEAPRDKSLSGLSKGWCLDGSCSATTGREAPIPANCGGCTGYNGFVQGATWMPNKLAALVLGQLL